MSAEAAFDSLRALKREMTGEPAIGLDQPEVDAFMAIISRWKPAAAGINPTALADAGKFFSSVRTSFGALTESQVQGFQALLQAFGVAASPIAYAAYALATAWHETAKAMQPVEEAYYLGAKAEAYRKTLRYYPWHGRGFVQLTWERNYQRADDELGLGGKLIATPALALDPKIAAEIMVKGMIGGWFSGKKLADYLPSSGPADVHQFANARQIINGLDKAGPIADLAMQFQSALAAGGWA